MTESGYHARRGGMPAQDDPYTDVTEPMPAVPAGYPQPYEAPAVPGAAPYGQQSSAPTQYGVQPTPPAASAPYVPEPYVPEPYAPEPYAAPSAQPPYEAAPEPGYVPPVQGYAAPAQPYAPSVQAHAEPAPPYVPPVQTHAEPAPPYVPPVQAPAEPAQGFAPPTYPAPAYAPEPVAAELQPADAAPPEASPLDRPGPAHEVTPVAPVNPLVVRSHTSLMGVLSSEWIKLRSLPSSWWVIGATIVVSVGMGAMLGYSMKMVHDAPSIVHGVQLPSDLVVHASDAVGMTPLIQLVLAILAILCVTNEYGSGLIRATLIAAPGRLSTLCAKTVVIAVVTAVVTFVGTYATVLVSWPFIRGFAVDDRFTWGGIRVVLGVTLATVLVAVFALAVGFLARNTAAGIGIVVALLFVVPIVLQFLHWQWVPTMHDYLIDQSQIGLYSSGTDMTTSASRFDFVKSLWVTGLWAVVPLAFAGILLKRRDA